MRLLNSHIVAAFCAIPKQMFLHMDVFTARPCTREDARHQRHLPRLPRRGRVRPSAPASERPATAAQQRERLRHHQGGKQVEVRLVQLQLQLQLLLFVGRGAEAEEAEAHLRQRAAAGGAGEEEVEQEVCRAAAAAASRQAHQQEVGLHLVLGVL